MHQEFKAGQFIRYRSGKRIQTAEVVNVRQESTHLRTGALQMPRPEKLEISLGQGKGRKTIPAAWVLREQV